MTRKEKPEPLVAPVCSSGPTPEAPGIDVYLLRRAPDWIACPTFRNYIIVGLSPAAFRLIGSGTWSSELHFVPDAYRASRVCFRASSLSLQLWDETISFKRFVNKTNAICWSPSRDLPLARIEREVSPTSHAPLPHKRGQKKSSDTGKLPMGH